MSKEIVLSVFACIAPLFFPWPVVCVVALVASWYFPWVAIIVGSIEDILYAPTTGVHHAFILGIAVTIIMYGVRYFVKTRIMES
jgi:hypothetical protein